MSAPKKKKIVFICTGNTCRSPMAEKLLDKALKEQKLGGFTITSAGTKAKRGDTINPKSQAVLEEGGIFVQEFKSKKIMPTMLRDAFAIVCMTESHRDYLMDMRWNVLRKAGVEEIENNVYSFAELTGTDVLDPYGKDMDCYRYVYALLATGMPKVIDGLRLREYAIVPKKRGRKKKTEICDEQSSAENKE